MQLRAMRAPNPSSEASNIGIVRQAECMFGRKRQDCRDRLLQLVRSQKFTDIALGESLLVRITSAGSPDFHDMRRDRRKVT